MRGYRPDTNAWINWSILVAYESALLCIYIASARRIRVGFLLLIHIRYGYWMGSYLRWNILENIRIYKRAMSNVAEINFKIKYMKVSWTFIQYGIGWNLFYYDRKIIFIFVFTACKYKFYNY